MPWCLLFLFFGIFTCLYKQGVFHTSFYTFFHTKYAITSHFIHNKDLVCRVSLNSVIITAYIVHFCKSSQCWMLLLKIERTCTFAGNMCVFLKDSTVWWCLFSSIIKRCTLIWVVLKLITVFPRSETLFDTISIQEVSF